MVRLSSAVALFGIEQVQSAVSHQAGERNSGGRPDLGTVLDAMSESLAEKMGPGKRDVLDSAGRIAEQVAQQSVEGLKMMDPRRVVQAANELVQKSTEAISNWPGGDSAAGGAKEDEKPKLAVDVLTAPEKDRR